MLLVLACSCIIHALGDEPAIQSNVNPQYVKTIAECRKLKPPEWRAYLRRLEKDKNLLALAELAKSDLDQASDALIAYVQWLDDQSALRVCKSFPCGSPEWSNAFWALHSHRKGVVIGYVKDICHSNGPYIRSQCYNLCTKARWNDLRAEAQRDAHDTTLVGPGIGITLGDYARSYLKEVP